MIAIEISIQKRSDNEQRPTPLYNTIKIFNDVFTFSSFLSVKRTSFFSGNIARVCDLGGGSAAARPGPRPNVAATTPAYSNTQNRPYCEAFRLSLVCQRGGAECVSLCPLHNWYTSGSRCSGLNFSDFQPNSLFGDVSNNFKSFSSVLRISWI